MQIQIISVTVETKPTAKGSYQQAEVVYKNLTYQGKVESKKIMSFGAGAPAFKALADAAPNSTYEVTVVKNDKGYNDWTECVPATAGAAPAAAKSAPARSTYETPEERAQRQTFIIRQSSVNYAIAMLTPGAKAPLKFEEVTQLAMKLHEFVVNGPSHAFLDDLPDDTPSVD